ncbi:hypothetical protein [Janthinobacterium sp. 13]|uniref:hypothetical protein n=1 Tax=Janthinobacterium sp. 13 TaxID=2035211 RepID=UPI000C5AF0E4|nr:hypothetical protein [Janthinobacterium sp. 13]PIF11268.1 hypothetical protein CLU94_3330 [Janthinobacterium sp. 13]
MLTYATANRAPSIHFEALPEEEHRHSHSICSELHALSSYIVEFESSLALFEDVTERLFNVYARPPIEDRTRLRDIERLHHWRKVAAQDCAMTIFHFGSARLGIHTSLGESKTMRTMMDAALLKKASKAFAEYFPDYQPMRNGIAHAEEKHMTDRDMAKNVSIGDPISNAINQLRGLSYSWGQIGLSSSKGSLSGGSLTDSVLSISNNNKMHSLEISKTTLGKLSEIRELYFDAFFTIEEKSRNARNALHAAGQPR